MNATVLVAGDVAMYYCFFVSVVFIFCYAILAKWWKTEFGRHLFFFMLVIALVFTYIASTKIFGRFTGWEWYRLILTLALGGVLTWRVWILIAVQIRNRSHAKFYED